MAEGLRGQARMRLLRRRMRVASLNNSLITANNREIVGLRRSIISQSSVLSNLNRAFKQADKLQVKALATGTTLAKFTKENNEVLNNMRGDFFENAQELLKNFSTGIRENSEGVVSLTNRMSVTGQSTDLMRGVMTRILATSKNNIESIDNLSKTTISLANQYSVSEGKLLEAVQAVGSLIRQTSLVGGGAQTAKLAEMLAAAAPAASLDQINKTMEVLISPDFFSQRVALGMRGTADRLLSQAATMEDLKSILMQLSRGSDHIIGTGEEANNLMMKTLRLRALGGADNIIAARNLGGLIENQTNVNGDMRAELHEFALSQENLKKEALNFYNKSVNEFYPRVLDILPSINRILAYGGVAGAAGAVGRWGTQGKGAVRGIASMAGFLGPWGLAISAGMAVLPDLLSIAKDSNEKHKKQTDHLANIDKKTPKPKTQESTFRYGNLAEFMANTIRDSLISNAKVSADALRLQKELLKVNKEMNDKTKRQSAAMPSKSIGSQR